MTHREKLAWAAGFFDGEGRISITGGSSMVLRVNQAERAPLHRIADVLGGKVYGPYSNAKSLPHRKPIFVWSLSSGPEVAKALRLLLPFLICKFDQATVALKFPLGKTGQPLTGEVRSLRAEVDSELRILKIL